MDTRFWGPSGWRLLHLISFTYEPTDVAHRDAVERVFTLLPYVLPCKFCRESLSIYMEEDPLVLTTKPAFSKWLWRIHNKVNAKLRSQGLLHEADPPYESVKRCTRKGLRLDVYGQTLKAGISYSVSPKIIHSPCRLGIPCRLNARKHSVVVPPTRCLWKHLSFYAIA